MFDYLFLCCLALLVVVRIVIDSDVWFFFFQAEDGIRDLVRSRGLGDVYKRQLQQRGVERAAAEVVDAHAGAHVDVLGRVVDGLSLIHI